MAISLFFQNSNSFIIWSLLTFLLRLATARGDIEAWKWQKKNFAKTSYFHTTFFFSFLFFSYLSPCNIRSETEKRWKSRECKKRGWNCETAFRNEEGTLDCDIKNIKILFFSLLFLSLPQRAFSSWIWRVAIFFSVCRGRNKNKFYKNMAYLFCTQESKEKKRSLCNHTDSSIFNLNKILFIRIAGNNCDLKMYLAQRNVPFKIKRSEFFNIFWEALRL